MYPSKSTTNNVTASVDQSIDNYFGFDVSDTELDDTALPLKNKGNGKDRLKNKLTGLKKLLPPPKPTRSAGPTRLLTTTKSRNLFKPPSMNQQSIKDAVRKTPVVRPVDEVPSVHRQSIDSFDNLFGNNDVLNDTPILFDSIEPEPQKVINSI